MVKRSGLDYDKLIEFQNRQKETKVSNRLPVEAVRNRMRKVAFDVYNIENDPYDSLWKLESNADDGKEYLVRMDSDQSVESKTGGWSATSNEAGTSVTLAYKNVPVQRLSGKIFGFSKEDVGLFKRALLEKIAKDEGFKEKVLDMQTDERKVELIQTFPELAQKE